MKHNSFLKLALPASVSGLKHWRFAAGFYYPGRQFAGMNIELSEFYNSTGRPMKRLVLASCSRRAFLTSNAPGRPPVNR